MAESNFATTPAPVWDRFHKSLTIKERRALRRVSSLIIRRQPSASIIDPLNGAGRDDVEHDTDGFDETAKMESAENEVAVASDGLEGKEEAVNSPSEIGLTAGERVALRRMSSPIAPARQASISITDLEIQPETGNDSSKSGEGGLYFSSELGLTVEERRALRRQSTLIVPFRRWSSTSLIERGRLEEEDSDDDEEGEDGFDATVSTGSDPPDEKGKAVQWFHQRRLTADERLENEAWRMRLRVGSVFRPDYTPLPWERSEMAKIVESLELNSHDIPNTMAEYLDEPGQEVNKKAVGSIFFPNQVGMEAQSVLLKRGTVLVEGEPRELMIFTRGFLLSCVEVDSLVNILLDAIANDRGDVSDPMLEAPDNSELHDLFVGMGMPSLTTKLESNCDDQPEDASQSENIGSLWGSLGIKFKRALISGADNAHKLDENLDPDLDGKISVNQPEDASQSQSTDSSWGSLGAKLMRALGGGADIARKLDVAYLMSDIEKIENVGVRYAAETKNRGITAWAEITFALFLKGVENPLVVTCTKPDHMQAWMEAFRTCMTTLKSLTNPPSSLRDQVIDHHTHLGLIRGAHDLPDSEKMEPDRLHSLERWRGSAATWGDDMDDQNVIW